MSLTLPTNISQDWCLLRIWDAMEFEDEQEQSSQVKLTGTGDIDEKDSKTIL